MTNEELSVKVTSTNLYNEIEVELIKLKQKENWKPVLKYSLILVFLFHAIFQPIRGVFGVASLPINLIIDPIIFLIVSVIVGLLYSTIPVIIRNLNRKIQDYIETRYPGGRKNPKFSNLMTIFLIVALLVFSFTIKIRGSDQIFSRLKLQWVAGLLVITSIFIIMAIGLNIHTGLTGMVNFGVIFFVGLGAASTGLLYSKFNIHPLIGMIIGVSLGITFGVLLAYPTVKLRTDYFAIVTIALGEILRLFLNVEPFFRARTESSGISSPGIAGIDGPFEVWWGSTFGAGENGLPYNYFLVVIGLLMVGLTLLVSQYVLNSPFGRVLKGIREDEEVVGSYGYDIFRYKLLSLGIGGGIMALAGSLWSWFLGNIFPDFMDPALSTFLVWAAFVLGGRGNNRGMIIGAYIITLADRGLRLVGSLQNYGKLNQCVENSGFLICGMDRIFRFVVIDIGGLIFGPSSYQGTLGASPDIHIEVNFLRLIFIGLIIIIVMRRSEEGVIPEVPYRPPVKGFDLGSKVFDVTNCPRCHSIVTIHAESCNSCGLNLKSDLQLGGK